MRQALSRTAIAKRLSTILFHDRVDIVRVGLIIGSLSWAGLLILPSDSFCSITPNGQHGTSPFYGITAVTVEHILGVMFLLQALVASYSLLTKTRSAFTLLFDGVLGCTLWTGCTAVGLSAYWPIHITIIDAIVVYTPPAAFSGTVIMAIYSWWCMIRHWAEEPTHTEKQERVL